MHPTDLTINDYVDQALGTTDRAEVERHLATCEECRQLVDDLIELRQRAAMLAPMQPPARAWARIEQAIRQAPAQRRRLSWSWPAGLAAAAAVVLCTIVGLRFGLSGRPAGITTSTSGDSSELAQSVQSELMQAKEHYQKAINGLQQIANSEKGALDPQTAAAVEKSMATVDQAINESSAAVKTQPNSEAAQQSLLDSFKTKIALLEDTVALINEMRKGNDAGAARIVSGLKQKS
jgi:hypothetical protein